MMVFAGRAQDKFGPRIVALFGGLMFGGGLILSGFATNPVAMVFTFGVMGGIGIGLGYSATTPCAIKWFESSKKRPDFRNRCFRSRPGASYNRSADSLFSETVWNSEDFLTRLAAQSRC